MKDRSGINKLMVSIATIALGAALAARPVFAAIDLRDYDNDLMRDLERTLKYFEPDLNAKNAEGAKEDAALLLDGFRYAEDYFSKKGANDAVEISRQGVALIDTVLKNVERSDFEAAAAAARDTPQLCKSCHDVYKPRLAR